MSQYQVSARKYRPGRFEDVVGQAHVSRTLKNALQSGQVAHAFLFCGPRGVGKTTCARILAKILNCEHRTADFEACNECASCRSFNENASFNIIELDAASNNSVEHIRTLVEQVRFPPQQGKYKVYIIDEVHMLSSAAFNAFLKTLEEPPPYAIFILATTEKHKIIPTILSRCQIYDFRRITVPDTVAHLRQICQKEQIEADEDALHIIAQKSDGALRDALSIFDRIASASQGHIRYADVLENLNVLDFDVYFKVTEALMTEDLPGVMLLFDDVLRKGFEGDIFINGLAEHFRQLLVCKDRRTLSLLEVSDNLRERYHEQAVLAMTSFLLTGLDIANDCDINYKMARHKRLHIEIALAKMAFSSRRTEILSEPSPELQEKKTPDLSKNDQKIPENTVEAPENPDNKAVLPSENATAPEILVLPALTKPSEFTTPKISLNDLSELIAAEDIHRGVKRQDLTMDLLVTFWQDYLNNLESQMIKLALGSSSLSLEDNKVTITVSSSFAKNTLQQEAQVLLQKIRSEVHAPDLVLEILLDASIASANVSAPKKVMTNKEKYEKMVESNPLVHELRKRFDLKLDQEG
jgi:DNA polymerase-3 subunit gamma/tau